MILIGILLVTAISLIIIKPNLNKQKFFEIEDKCGRFLNLLSHTIDDESTCRSRCIAQCISNDYKFDKVEFNKENVGCNSCMCFCN